jgi:hypothetical protein
MTKTGTYPVSERRNARSAIRETGYVPVFCYSTVTDFARLRGLSTSVPRQSAAW